MKNFAQYIRKQSVALAFGCLIASLLPATVGAQSENPKASLEIVVVRHANADELAKMLMRAFPSHFHAMADPRTQRLILQATSSSVMESARKLIAELDIPVPGASGTSTVVLQLRHRKAADLLDVVRVRLSPTGRVATEHARNALVVRDLESNVESVRKLVENLDVAPGRAAIELLVLGPNGSALEGAQAQHLGVELERLGLAGYGVVSRLMVLAVEGEQFAVEEGNTFRKLSILGKLDIQDVSSSALLNLGVDLEKQSQNGVSTVQFQSTLNIPLGDQAIVGLAPTGEDGAKPLVLVVSVKPDRR